MVKWILEPLVVFAAEVLTNVGLASPDGGFSAEEAMAAQGHVEAAAEAYRLPAQVLHDRVYAVLRRAQLLAGPLKLPPANEAMRVGLALTELHEQRLDDPGRAMAERRRLIDRYPHGRQARELRGLLAVLRPQHLPQTAP